MAIETLNVDGKELKVSELSQQVQRLVAIYEDTHNKRNELENQHIALSAALRQLSVDITAEVNKSSLGEETPDACEACETTSE